MKLKTRATELVYWRVRRPLGRLGWKVVYALPKKLVYFAAIRLIAHATVGEYGNQGVHELRAIDALDRWATAR